MSDSHRKHSSCFSSVRLCVAFLISIGASNKNDRSGSVTSRPIESEGGGDGVGDDEY